MSPTSYQTAPPRIGIITMSLRAVKRGSGLVHSVLHERADTERHFLCCGRAPASQADVAAAGGRLGGGEFGLFFERRWRCGWGVARMGNREGRPGCHSEREPVGMDDGGLRFPAAGR